jgi:integrase
MSVRKREWTTSGGERREAWVCAYTDGQGDRHIQTFERKKDADAFQASVKVDVGRGVHTAPSKSITVAEGCRLWLETGQSHALERTTLDSYRQHSTLHIVPLLGTVKLSALTTATIREFEDRLRGKGTSPVMTKRVLTSLGSMLADAQERGLVAQNVVRNLRTSRRGKDTPRDSKLVVGVDIPTPREIRALVQHLSGRWRPLLLCAIFTGLRASELRGLRWSDMDFKRRELHVRQRADRYGVIGPPKSKAGERTVPLSPLVVNTLREWKAKCPPGALVFPNGAGNVENHQNILNRGFFPAQVAAGITDAKGAAKYTGLHALRHFYASWCINRRADGGLELPLKNVQERLGHSTVVLTSDRYGHLFPRGDDGAEMAAAERLLLA